jgi:hypothetical protein
MPSWMNELAASANQIERLRRTGGLQAQAQGARDLCTIYTDLLINTDFRRVIEQQLQTIPSQGFPLQPPELRLHIGEAIKLLVEAGVNGELAVDALRSVEELLTSAGVTLPPNTQPEAFFGRLRDAKVHTCELSELLQTEAASETRGRRLRGLAYAGVGLALVGATGGGLALVAAPVLGSVAAGGGTAILAAIGAIIFDRNVPREDRRAP